MNEHPFVARVRVRDSPHPSFSGPDEISRRYLEGVEEALGAPVLAGHMAQRAHSDSARCGQSGSRSHRDPCAAVRSGRCVRVRSPWSAKVEYDDHTSGDHAGDAALRTGSASRGGRDRCRAGLTEQLAPEVSATRSADPRARCAWCRRTSMSGRNNVKKELRAAGLSPRERAISCR